MINKLFNNMRLEPIFSNVAVGTHAGQITRTLESDVSTRYLLGKVGSTSQKVDVAGAGDLPLGVITDAGGSGDLVNVSLLGSAQSSVLMVASEVISAGDDVYTAVSGKVQDQPASVGTYYHVGRALTDAAGDGDVVEVDPLAPRKTAVIPAFSGTVSSDLGNLGFAHEGAADKVIILGA